MDSYAMANVSSFDIPPLPSYTLSPKPSWIPGLSDLALQTISPVVAYWIISIFFFILDEYNIFSQYRLHTPAELLKRNHVSKKEVFRDVVLQQVVQAFTGYTVSAFDPPEMLGKEQYDIAVWAQRLRKAERYIPRLFAVFGVNSSALSTKIGATYPTLASILAGGQYGISGFADWELSTGKYIYWVGIPVIQFVAAMIILDTWQYFVHRAMHMNKLLYTWLHSRHHRLYVPYAFGALYNHPIEGFFMDTLSAGIAYVLTGMTLRQGIVFFTCSTIKTVDDHCGYHFPWDPLQHFTSNNAAYHDVHHQSWGIKTNFSQPYFIFWDRVLNTAWAGGDVSSRYQRDRLNAQKKLDADRTAQLAPLVNSPTIDLDLAAKQAAESQQQVLENERGRQALKEEVREEINAEIEVRRQLRRSPRRRTSTFDAKSLSKKVSGSRYSRGTPVLKADGIH